MLAPGIVIEGDFVEFESLLEQIATGVVRFSAKEIVIGVGEILGDTNYYVLAGRINSELIHENGGLIELNVRGRGSILPLLYTFEKTSMEANLQFTALTDCELLILPRDVLTDMVKANPNMAISMMNSYARWGTYMNYSLLSLFFDPIRTRVSDFLIMQSNAYGEVFATQSDISKAISASRPNVAHALSAMGRQRMIETHRGSIVIQDRKALLEGCSLPVRRSFQLQ